MGEKYHTRSPLNDTYWTRSHSDTIAPYPGGSELVFAGVLIGLWSADLAYKFISELHARLHAPSHLHLHLFPSSSR